MGCRYRECIHQKMIYYHHNRTITVHLWKSTGKIHRYALRGSIRNRKGLKLACSFFQSCLVGTQWKVIMQALRLLLLSATHTFLSVRGDKPILSHEFLLATCISSTTVLDIQSPALSIEEITSGLFFDLLSQPPIQNPSNFLPSHGASFGFHFIDIIPKCAASDACIWTKLCLSSLCSHMKSNCSRYSCHLSYFKVNFI